jgi:DNA topoisomerase-1
MTLARIQDTLEVPDDGPEEAAAAAGLHYVVDAQPGIARRRRGRGFSYHDVGGATISDENTLGRIRSLAIPPAWTDVWICADPKGHLQATGRDVKGRKQYRYHPRWREVRDANKFAALSNFGAVLPDVRERLDVDLRRPGLPREKVLAVVVRLLDETLIRVGNKEYAEDNESYGLTTLTRDHAEVGWKSISLDFLGKSGNQHLVTVEDGRLARIVRRCHELNGQTLFTYDDEGPQPVTSADVNDYLHQITGLPVTAKDFRTWGGTANVTGHLGPLDPPDDEAAADAAVLEAIDAAAAELRNTRAVCRNCYVHPAVVDAYRDGSLSELWSNARTSSRMTRAERTVMNVLGDVG